MAFTNISELQAFIDSYYIAVPKLSEHVARLDGADYGYVACDAGAVLEVAEPPADLAVLAARLEDSFSVALIKLIQAKGRDDAEVYKRAGIDRRHFSKIRSNTGYVPTKRTVLALAVALELTLDEACALLGRAGYSLSRSVLFDVIIEYFITHCKYDIFEINDVLSQFDQVALVEVGS